jgi:hypothetical protein
MAVRLKQHCQAERDRAVFPFAHDPEKVGSGFSEKIMRKKRIVAASMARDSLKKVGNS